MGIKMVSAARLLLLGLATAGAMLLTAGGSVDRASAQGDACKADVITATGRGKFRPLTKSKELEGRGSAMADAVAAWQRDVGGKFGDDWKLWDKATDKSFNCSAKSTGKIIGGNIIGCTISGRPCLASAAPATVADAGKKTRQRNRDNDDNDRDDDNGYADDGDDGRTGTSAYRRAMNFQDRLASRRQRLEQAGLDRENARQRYLLEARKRAESRAYDREKSRQRYLAAGRNRYEGRRRWWDNDD